MTEHRKRITETEKQKIVNLYFGTHELTIKNVAHVVNMNEDAVKKTISQHRLKASIEMGGFVPNNEMEYGGESFRNLLVPVDNSITVGGAKCSVYKLNNSRIL